MSTDHHGPPPEQRDDRETEAVDAALRATTARLERIVSAREKLAELARRAITEPASAVIPAATHDVEKLLGDCAVTVVRDPNDTPAANAHTLAVTAPVAEASVVTVVVTFPAPRELDADERQWLDFIAIIVAAVLQRDTAEERLRFEALHDSLTGLPNRALLLDRLRHALERARRAGTSVAVMLLDLDDFKWINDSFGHLAGDAALVAFAGNLHEAARADDTVGRFGGDEFLVIIEHLARGSDVVPIAERMQLAWSQPVAVAERTLFLSASAGIAIASGDRAHDAPQLLREADQAMYRVKRRQPGRFEIFSAVTEASPDRLRLAADLRDTIAHGGLSLAYQPIVSSADGSLIALEALCRWTHAELGPIEPAVFIPIAEESGLIVPLGRWVIARACADAARWRDDGEGCAVQVNVSPTEFTAEQFVQTVTDALQAAGIPPRTLGLEITEPALLADIEASHRTLERLRTLGVRLMLDDVGTDAAALASLQAFRSELDGIKIDRRFVTAITSEDDEANVVAAVARLGDSFGMSVVAEGVETDVQRARVRALGCDFVQGWNTGAPVAEDEVRTLFTRRREESRKGTAASRAESD